MSACSLRCCGRQAQAIIGRGIANRRRLFLTKVRGQPAAAVTGAVRRAIALAIIVRRNMETSRFIRSAPWSGGKLARVQRNRIPKS